MVKEFYLTLLKIKLVIRLKVNHQAMRSYRHGVFRGHVGEINLSEYALKFPNILRLDGNATLKNYLIIITSSLSFNIEVSRQHATIA